MQVIPELVEAGEDPGLAEVQDEDEFDLADVMGEEGGLESKEARLKSVEEELAQQVRFLTFPLVGRLLVMPQTSRNMQDAR